MSKREAYRKRFPIKKLSYKQIDKKIKTLETFVEEYKDKIPLDGICNMLNKLYVERSKRIGCKNGMF